MEITSASPSTPTSPVPFKTALRFWLKLGFISFGGPAGQIAVMHRELVERRRWISERRFLHALNYCMLLPGPEAQQLATYIGWLMHRTWGGIAAGGLFVLPSFVILIALSWVYVKHGHTPLLAAFFSGIKPAVVALVAFAAYRIGVRVLHSAVLVGLAAAAFVAIFAFDLPFPWIVLGAGLCGYLGGRIAPARFRSPERHGSGGARETALIDDHTAAPAHAALRWRAAVITLAAGLAAWGGVWGVLAALLGAEAAPVQMGGFFTLAALVTFGGAYAVLPFVYQGAVERFAWLTPEQMIDGLALGETTPGPLIMVVTFVGFLGGWSDTSSALDPFAAALLCAATATYFTFLPSFIFIFFGAPLTEATRDNHRLAAALTGITAAVVGVIVNLALFFAYHVFWPQGFGGRFDWTAVIIGVAAALALWRYSTGVVAVVLGAGLAGVLLAWLRTLLG